MINLISYIFYSLSNLLFIFLLPDTYTKFFLANYSLASGIFTYLNILIYSNKIKLNDSVIILIGLFSLVTYVFLNYRIPESIYIWIYTGILIYSDYYFSQRQSNTINFLIKLSLFFLSLLLLFNFLSPIDIMQMKILLLTSFILFFYFTSQSSFTKLNVNNPNLYVLSTCCIYFGSLFVLSIYINDQIIKFTYISFQLFLTFQLKMFDLKLRSIFTLKTTYRNFLNILSFVFFTLFSIYFQSFLVLFMFLISYFSLNYVDKKFVE